MRFDWKRDYDFDGFCPDERFIHTKTLLTIDLEREKRNLLFEIMKTVSWAFGLIFEMTYLESFDKLIKNR